jgi:hypothetical protein
MTDGSYANRLRSATSDSDVERARDRASPRELAAAGPAPTRFLLGLQHAAGNAAVVQMLQRGAAPTVLRLPTGGAAPVPGAPEPGSDDSGEQLTVEERQAEEARNAEEQQAAAAGGPEGPAVDEARAADVAAGGLAVVPEPPAVDPDEKHPPAERAAKLAETDEGPIRDEGGDLAFGPPPQASAESPGAAFVDGSRRGSVPFTDAIASDLEGEPDGEPHAFTAGGNTGGIAWAGGTNGMGPKGNQLSGSVNPLAAPWITGEWGGLMSKASAWVIPGTGIAEVERSYLTSGAGDQGTGWWVSPKAAARLEQHEQKHVASSQKQYGNYIQPVLDNVEASTTTGREASYFLSDAKAMVKERIGEFWPGIEAFVAEDKEENGKGGKVDKADLASATWVRERGHFELDEAGNRGEEIHGGKVDGKEFAHLLQTPEEPVEERPATPHAPVKP